MAEQGFGRLCPETASRHGSWGDANFQLGRLADWATGDRVTWSGVTARTARLPVFWDILGWHKSPFLHLSEGPTHGAVLLDPQKPHKDKKWCCPAQDLGLGTGLLQVPLALALENAAFPNLSNPPQEWL